MSQQVAVQSIPIGKLRSSKFNVRRELGDISELVLSIKSVGILEPVIARPVGREFEVVIGSRRLAAARKAGLKSVPAIVKKLTNDEAIVESLTENLQRGDLTEEEIVRAFTLLRDFDPKRWTQEAFAKKIGKSQQWVSQLLTAYYTVVKLRESGKKVQMKSYPTKEEREAGAVPLKVLEETEYALRSDRVKATLPKKAIEKRRVEITDAVSDLDYDNAKRVIDRFKMYPEKPVEKIREEALAATAGVALKTYLPPTMARQIEEKTGKPVEDGLTQVLERGLQSLPPSSQEERGTMKHWAEELTQDPPWVQVGNWWKWNRERIDGKFDFFTTHYSGKDLDTFLETLKANGVRTLIDVRDTPFSQFRPEFNKESISKSLQAKGISYEHHPELGVPKEQRERLAKTENWSALFEWYDKNVIPKLNAVANGKERKPIAFMCVEKDPTKCHRHRIALALEKTGSKSLDL